MSRTHTQVPRIFQGGGCLLATLGPGPARLPCMFQAHSHGCWGQLGEQSAFSAASLLRPQLDAHLTLPGSSRRRLPLAVVTRSPALGQLLSSPLWARPVGAALLELGL